MTEPDKTEGDPTKKYQQYNSGDKVRFDRDYGSEILIVESVRNIESSHEQKMMLHNQIVRLKHQDGRLIPASVSGYWLEMVERFASK